MNRRRMLELVGAGAVGSFAGCVAGYQRPEAPEPTPEDVFEEVPLDQLERGASKDGIPAIVDPVFGEDWSGVELEARRPPFRDSYLARPRLQPDDFVVGVVRGGEARAYPLRVLNWHEVINEWFDGPLLVTYCPLCGSAMTAVRRVDGEETTFGVSGLLYKNDLVMYDVATESLWSQLEARAIRGPKTGTELDLVPSSFVTWRDWKAEYPDTLVLRPPPESNTVSGRNATRNYEVDPYLGYSVTDQIGLGGEYSDDRLHPKAQVIGITHDGVSKAYPLGRVERERVVNDTVNGLPVVVAAIGIRSSQTGIRGLVAYDRRVAGRVRQFTVTSGALASGGTRWDPLSGAGISGPLAGATLRPANDLSPLFFFAWKEFHPETLVYGQSRRGQ